MNWSYWESDHMVRDVQYLIVGAGLTGLQVAIEIKEKDPQAKVVVVDRSYWSQGASVKNAGFACFANVGEMLNDLTSASEEEVFRLALERFNGIEHLIEKYGEKEVGFRHCGTQEVFFDQNKQQLYKCIDALQGFNTLLYNLIGKDGVFSYSSSSDINGSIGCIKNRFEGVLNSGKLYERVLEYSISIGVRVLGGVEIMSWNETDKVELIMEGGGSLIAEKAVFCVNGFSHKLLETEIVPARGQVILSKKLKDLHLPSAYMYDRGYYYWREIDGKLLLGGARNIDIEEEQTSKFGVNEKISNELLRFAEKLVGIPVEIEQQWSGIMGMGRTKSPNIEKIGPNTYVAAGLGGMGVALSGVVAQKLVKKIFS